MTGQALTAEAVAEAEKYTLDAVVGEQAGDGDSEEIEREGDEQAGGFVIEEQFLPEVQGLTESPNIGHGGGIEQAAGGRG
jgi:hypothetical protein